jgi:hypothetical protein
MDLVPVLAVTALAVARITRLITTDYLTAGPRSRLIRRLGVDHKVSYLITCPWCASVWVGAVVAPAAYWWGGHAWFWLPASALAYSHVAGLLAGMEGDS